MKTPVIVIRGPSKRRPRRCGQLGMIAGELHNRAVGVTRVLVTFPSRKAGLSPEVIPFNLENLREATALELLLSP